MIEDVAVTRRQHVERINGRLATWWHYNRVTLALLLPLLAALLWLYGLQWLAAGQLQADAAVLAHAPEMACYSAPRSTSLIVAGGSQQTVDAALRAAVEQIDATRGAWYVARTRILKPQQPIQLVKGDIPR